MILGYEQPIDIPMMSMYDKDMMKMYLGALLRDYELGIAEQKEFNEKYAGFISPSMKDTENYYNLSLGPIQLYLNLNPNAIRSVEGRAKLRLLINSIPYDKLALIRQTAATGDIYRKALQQGVANGTIDYATALKLDGDLNNWDTASQGAWEKVAPTAQKGFGELLSPYIEELAKHGYADDPVESAKKGKGWLVKTVSDNKIKDSIGAHAADILNDPMMNLRIKESGLSPEEYLNNVVFGYMKDRLPKQEAEDKVWMDLQGLGLKRQELGLKRQGLAIQKLSADTAYTSMLLSAGYTFDKNGKPVKPNTPTVPLSAHQEADYASVQKRNSFLGGGSNGGNSKAFESRLNEYIAYYKNLANNPKLKKEATKRLNWALEMKKQGFGKAVENNFFKVNENGDLIPTAAWENAYTTVQTNKFVTMPKYDEATNRAITYRNTYKTSITDDGLRKSAASRFAGTSVIDKNINAGDGIQHRKVSLSKGDMVFSPYRALYVSGVNDKNGFVDRNSNIARKFDKFVHKNLLIGLYTNDSYSKMGLVSAPRSNGGRSYEIDAPVLIKFSDVAAFARSIGRDDIQAVADELGLRARDLQGKIIGLSGKNVGKQQWDNVSYFEADFTRIENNDNTNSAGAYDYEVDKNRYGQNNATKYVIDRQARSANRK